MKALVPFADLHNHRYPSETSWDFDDERKGFVLKAVTDIPRGQEVFDSYGDRPNCVLLLGYNFTLPNNPYDTIEIHDDLENCPKHNFKTDLLDDKFIPKKFVSGREFCIFEYLGFIRYKLFEGQESVLKEQKNMAHIDAYN